MTETLCKYRIEGGGVYGLCTVGDAAIGTHRYSRCHRRLCESCTESGEETKNISTPNSFLASVLIDAATTAMAQPRHIQSKDVLKSMVNRWRQFLLVLGGKPGEKPKAKYLRPNKCEHLGATPISRIKCNCPKLFTFECGKFKAEDGTKLHVIPAKQCETCNGYEDEETVGAGCDGCEQGTK